MHGTYLVVCLLCEETPTVVCAAAACYREVLLNHTTVLFCMLALLLSVEAIQTVQKTAVVVVMFLCRTTYQLYNRARVLHSTCSSSIIDIYYSTFSTTVVCRTGCTIQCVQILVETAVVFLYRTTTRGTGE